MNQLHILHFLGAGLGFLILGGILGIWSHRAQGQLCGVGMLIIGAGVLGSMLGLVEWPH